MTDYRIYVLNPQDRIAEQFVGDFQSDRDALERAEDLLAERYAAEVWQGERLVGRLGGGLRLARG